MNDRNISVMEQIARDMREGTFPKKSEQTLSKEMSCENISASSTPAATWSDHLITTELGSLSTARATELPENVRIPLNSLQADLAYLIGRVIADGSCGPMVIQSMRDRLDQIEAHLISAPTAGPTP